MGVNIDQQLEGYFVLKKAALDKHEALAMTTLTAGNYRVDMVMAGLKKIQQDSGKVLPAMLASAGPAGTTGPPPPQHSEFGGSAVEALAQEVLHRAHTPQPAQPHR